MGMFYYILHLVLYIYIYKHTHTGFPGGSMVKDLPANAGGSRDVGSTPVSGRSPGVGKWQPAPVFLPGEIHRQRSLVGYIQSIRLQRVRHDLTTYIYIYIHTQTYTYIHPGIYIYL